MLLSTLKLALYLNQLLSIFGILSLTGFGKAVTSEQHYFNDLKCIVDIYYKQFKIAVASGHTSPSCGPMPCFEQHYFNDLKCIVDIYYKQFKIAVASGHTSPSCGPMGHVFKLVRNVMECLVCQCDHIFKIIYINDLSMNDDNHYKISDPI